jgi:hypothetical protein
VAQTGHKCHLTYIPICVKCACTHNSKTTRSIAEIQTELESASASRRGSHIFLSFFFFFKMSVGLRVGSECATGIRTSQFASWKLQPQVKLLLTTFFCGKLLPLPFPPSRAHNLLQSVQRQKEECS